MATQPLALYYSPQTRATAVRVLLEELGAPYELHILNMKKGEQRQPAYLAINPMGKVPAIRHGDALVTELAAIFIYLGDVFPEAGLAPAIGDPLRGPYLRKMIFYGNCFEPALVDKAMKRNAPPTQSPYGTYDTVLNTLVGWLQPGPHMLGEKFSTLDLLWGLALRWTTMFGLVPELPQIKTYIARTTERPAFKRVSQLDAELAAQHEKDAAASG
jgi:glutathione S-transferase